MQNLGELQSLEAFAVDILRASPLSASELRALKYNMEIPLFPEVSTDRFIREIAHGAQGTLDYGSKVGYLRGHFPKIIDAALQERNG